MSVLPLTSNLGSDFSEYNNTEFSEYNGYNSPVTQYILTCRVPWFVFDGNSLCIPSSQNSALVGPSAYTCPAFAALTPLVIFTFLSLTKYLIF